MKYSRSRGTLDIYGQDVNYFNKIIDVLKLVSKIYCFEEMITPIFESKELFMKNIGEATDIVVKEFYDFKDKGDRDLVLRPEGTLPIIRSVIENKLIFSEPLPLKYFYIGPMFRYERPQSGRQRQFYQYGVEYIGINNIYQQVEIIMMALSILNIFKINNFTLKINYLGSIESRNKWIEELKKYFSKFKKELSKDSIERINKNPLRILDDKEDSKKEFVLNAPIIDNFLSESETKEKNDLIRILSEMKIKFEFDNKMVRGLDYYSGLVFEFISNLNILNNQSTLIGGGKYDNVFQNMDEKQHSCIGFAIGIERLIIALKNENFEIEENYIDVYFANISSDNLIPTIIISLLRASGISVDIDFNSTKLDKHFKLAEKKKAKIILIFGNKEQQEEKIILKNQDNKKEQVIKLKNIVQEVKKNLKRK